MVTYNSFAKINLFLHILYKRDDGYHDLQTWFTFIDLKDQLSFSFNDTGIVNIQSDIAISSKQDNLIYKAIKLFRNTYDMQHIGVDVTVVKNIPMGAGLGGGSSNAATALVAIRDYCSPNITNTDMLPLGAKLGADVPIFLYGKSAWAEGIGDILYAKEFKICYALLVKPNLHVSTREFFESDALVKNTCMIDKNLTFDPEIMHNDFERVFYDSYPEIKSYLSNIDSGFRMTGTGSCFYLMSSDKSKLLKLMANIDKSLDKWLVKTLNYVY